MQECIVYRNGCSGCGGSREMPIGSLGELRPCSMCGGSGKQVAGKVEIDVPTVAQFADKFNEIKNGLQAIWNKVKDLP